eukprot:scaffold11318_cov198-Isochrysis_galbana.AAC.1
MQPAAALWSRIAARGGGRSAPIDASADVSAERKLTGYCPPWSGKELAASTVPAWHMLAMPRREPWPSRGTRLCWLVLLVTSRARLREPQTGSGRPITTLFCYKQSPSLQLILGRTGVCLGYFKRASGHLGWRGLHQEKAAEGLAEASVRHLPYRRLSDARRQNPRPISWDGRGADAEEAVPDLAGRESESVAPRLSTRSQSMALRCLSSR